MGSVNNEREHGEGEEEGITTSCASFCASAPKKVRLLAAQFDQGQSRNENEGSSSSSSPLSTQNNTNNNEGEGGGRDSAMELASSRIQFRKE